MNIARLLLIGALLASPSTWSESTDSHDDEPAEHGNSHDVAYHKNLVGLFTGITHKNRGTNELAVGLEYERRINESFGIGAVAEYTGGDADVWIYAVPFAWHTGHWKLYLAPGVEDGHHGTQELVRIGGEYAFHLSDGWEIAPQINVDIVDSEEVLVFGVVFARGF
jgi:hypothetical protein